MRKRKINLRLSSLFTIMFCWILSFLFSNPVSAQTVFDPHVNCVNGCTAKDIKKITAALVYPDPPNAQLPSNFSCNNGDNVNVKLAVFLTTQTQKAGIYVYANIRNSSTNALIKTVSECFSSGALTTVGEATKVVFNEAVTWSCGTIIKLTDVYVAWGTGNEDFCVGSPLPRCPATTSKCFALGEGEYIPIVIPIGSGTSQTKCSTSPGGTTATFNLTESDATIIGSQTGVHVRWYSNAAGTIELTGAGKTAFVNTSNPQTVYAKVCNDPSPGTVCSGLQNVTLNVVSSSAGGTTAAAASPVCSGSGTTISLSGQTGAIQKWQYSTNGTDWTDINSTDNPLSTGNLTQTTQFRAVVKSGICDAANSSAATVTVNPTTVGGSTAAGTSPVCSGSGTTILLSGHTGAIQKWQYSTNGTDWTDIVSTANPINTGNLTQTTQFRAVVKSGVCASQNSSAATVTVDPTTVGGSTAAGTSPVCSGSGTTILLSGHTWAIQKWQYSTNGTDWTDIVSTANPINTGNLTQTTQFRAVVKSGVCASQNSSAATVTVDPTTVGGSAAAGTSPVCSGSGTTILLSGHTGAIQKWQYSTNGTDWTDIVSTANPINTGNLTQTTQFRAVVKSGVCASQNSSAATVTVSSNPAAPTVTYIPPTCLETTFKVSVDNPHSGSTYTLRQLSGGVSVVTKSAPADVVAGKIVFDNLTIGKGYRVTETTGGGCISSPATCGDFSSVVGAQARTQDQSLTLEQSPTTVTAYPNPFSNKVKFVVTSPVAGRGSLEVYNMMGQKVKTVYHGLIVAGTQTFELSLPAQQISNLVYVLRIGDKKMSGKLLQINQ